MPPSSDLILASGSPRRKELLERFEIPFVVQNSGVSEEVHPEWTAVEMVKKLSLKKARAVASQLSSGLVIGADTTLEFRGQILGKPADDNEARQMISHLKGRTHKVITGVALWQVGTEKSLARAVTTYVRMGDYSQEKIDSYVKSGEPMGKAGSYAIQGRGGQLVKWFNGCYSNVVGLPLCEMARLLEEFDLPSSPSPPPCLLPQGEICPRLYQ